VSRLCSAGSKAPMRGAGGSHVNLCAASRDQSHATWPSAHRAERIADFHPAGWTARPWPFMLLTSQVSLWPEHGRRLVPL